MKRCVECRQVRGNSSFRLVKDGTGRVDVCRWCEERSGNYARRLSATHHTLGSLRRQEGELRAKLALVRRQIRLKEVEAASITLERQKAS